jgi:3-phenylpropionate/trans-cinnamate dioxygenase ferredoxin reductase subunit
MSPESVDILLIGGGVASAAAAHELREAGFDGSVMLVTRELDPPYRRPPVTKELLTSGDESGVPVRHDDWWREQGIDLRTRASVMSLDVAARTATLAGKQEIAFGGALVATGAMVRRLNVEGAQLEGVHYLRAPGNARSLREDLGAAEHVVVVGGSFIATEVAASVTALGKRCTIVMQEDRPLERVFGALVADVAGDVLAERGIEIVSAEDVVAFEGEERVSSVRTASGRRVDGDLVVVGAGAVPDTMLAKRAGLELGESGGVRCDRYLRTSAERIYAAGDMCEYESTIHGCQMRVEHEEHAIAQGRTAARNLLGEQLPHEVVPYFWCDLADWVTFESLGPAIGWDREIVTGSVAERSFTVWYLRDDRVIGTVSVNDSAAVEAARPLVAARAPSAEVAGAEPVTSQE